jgi:hypothetical protein
MRKTENSLCGKARGVWHTRGFGLAAVAGLTLVLTGPARAECLSPVGDVTANGATNVVDVQCSINVALWILTGSVDPTPACTPDPDRADLNCDGTVNVVDLDVVIRNALGSPLNSAIDANGNQCADACELLSCGDGTCDPQENVGNCPSDCPVGAEVCCLPHASPGCNNPDVQACVCAVDASCCNAAWDESCALQAEQCGSCEGECCSPNETAGCGSTGNLGCESCVCAVDGYCCDVAWDSFCAECAAGTGGLDACVVSGGCADACGCVIAD